MSIKAHFKDYIKIISVVHIGQEIVYYDYAATEKHLDRIIGVSEDIVKGIEKKGVNKGKSAHILKNNFAQGQKINQDL